MKIFNKVLVLSLMVFITVTISSCGNGGSVISERIKYLRAQSLQETILCEVGNEYKSEWHNFTVESIEEVSNYAGYSAQEGNTLYKVKITETCVIKVFPVVFGTIHWHMDSDELSEYARPLDPLDNTMMPVNFILDYKESATYIMIFEVPQGLNDLKLVYPEIGNHGKFATFMYSIK